MKLKKTPNLVWCSAAAKMVDQMNKLISCDVIGGLSPESTTEWASLLRGGKPTTQLAVHHQRPSAPTISVVILQKPNTNKYNNKPRAWQVQCSKGKDEWPTYRIPNCTSNAAQAISKVVRYLCMLHVMWQQTEKHHLNGVDRSRTQVYAILNPYK